MLLIDDFTIMVWVAFLREKPEAFNKFKVFKSLVENESGHGIKCLRSDNRGEFTSNEFNQFCESHGIQRQFFTTKTPHQNRVLERKNKTVQETTRTMLLEANIADTF